MKGKWKKEKWNWEGEKRGGYFVSIYNHIDLERPFYAIARPT